MNFHLNHIQNLSRNSMTFWSRLWNKSLFLKKEKSKSAVKNESFVLGDERSSQVLRSRVLHLFPRAFFAAWYQKHSSLYELFGCKSSNCGWLQSDSIIKNTFSCSPLPTSTTDCYLSPATGACQVKGLQGGVRCPPSLQLFNACSYFNQEHLSALMLKSN